MRKYINWLKNVPKQVYALVMIAAASAVLPVALNALGPTNDTVFTIDKKVRVVGTAEWKDSTTAKPGDTVEYQVTYTNNSKAQQLNVALRDKMSKGLQYVANSSVLNGTKLSDKLMESGVNLGNHNSGGNAVVYYKATIPNKENLSCGTTTLKNTATINVGNTPKSDEATVTVQNECQQAPIYKCNALTIEKISQDDFKFSVQYAASNGATFKKVTYKVYDSNNNEVYNSDKGNFNGFKPGKYTAKAFITVTIGDSEKTVTSETCEKQFVIDGQNQPTNPNTPNTPKPDTPSTPTTPNKPDTPSTPNKPSTPSDPSKPDTPNRPSTPTTPNKPDKSSEPAKPNTPNTPNTPSKPSEPAKPVSPTTPAKPATPSKPDPTPTNQTPVTPSKPSTPASPSSANNPSSSTPSSTTNTESTVKNPSAEPAALPKTGMNDPLVGGLGLGALMTAGLAYAISRRRI